MKKRVQTMLLLILLLFSLIPAAAAEGEGEGEGFVPPADNGCSYFLRVNRELNTVTVYALDEEGTYSIPVKNMICSTGVYGHRTPIGYYKTGIRQEWGLMFDGNWGQYTTQFNGNMLFHSVCYSRRDPSALLAFEYNDLGKLASSGCVRLQVADAKWIYENCEKGTLVEVYESEDPGPLGMPERMINEITAELDNGWEPTDPREENPWHALLEAKLTVEEEALELTAGERTGLHWSAEVFEGSALHPAWSSSDPAVATVNENGMVLALAEGSAELTLSCGVQSVSIPVRVRGQLLPYDDLIPGAWYYADARFAVENGILKGTAERRFSPNMSTTRAMVLQTLYNMSRAGNAPGSEESAGGAWYAKALAWAAAHGIVEGNSQTAFSLNQFATRQEFAVMLYRFEMAFSGVPAEAEAALSAFQDGGYVFAFAERAVSWAVAKGLIAGDENGKLLPGSELSRVQLAAILRRYQALKAK